MGLIKTAMLAGVGVYGISQISTAEARRHNAGPSNGYRSTLQERQYDSSYDQSRPSDAPYGG